MRANKPSSLFICSAWNKCADFTMPLMEIIPKLYFMEVLEMTNDYLKMLFEKEEDVRNSLKKLMDRSKEKDDVEHMSDSEFEEKRLSYGLATDLIEENKLLCRIIIGIANKQDIILEKLEKLENRA
nr:MAG TPA: hypothetical protein [Caudoviricetes sp.]